MYLVVFVFVFVFAQAPAPHFVFPVQDVCCCAYRYVDWHVRLCRARPGCPFRRSWRGSGWRLVVLVVVWLWPSSGLVLNECGSHFMFHALGADFAAPA